MFTALIFILTFLSMIVLSIRKGAVFLFLLYQAYYFFNPPTKWWSYLIPDLSYSFYIVLTLLIVVAINWQNYAENRLRAIPQFQFMYLMVLLYLLASFYAVLPNVHSIASDALLTVAVVVSLVYKVVSTEKHLDYIIGGYILFAGYLGYYISQVGRTSSGRFEGAGMVDSPDGNGVAAAIAPSLIFCLYYFWAKTQLKYRLPLVVIGAFLATAIVQIGSRGAFLGIFVGASVFLFVLFTSKMQRKNQKLGVIMIVLMGLGGVVTVTDEAFWDRMRSIKSEGEERETEVETGATRIEFWKAAIDMAKDHPFGAGASGFIVYSPNYIAENVNTGKRRNRAVHSTWFEVLTEIGYLGAFAFCGMIYYSFYTMMKTARKLKESHSPEKYFKVVAINCALLSFVVIMTFLNRLRAEILYWCILYTATAYNVYVLKAPPKED